MSVSGGHCDLLQAGAESELLKFHGLGAFFKIYLFQAGAFGKGRAAALSQAGRHGQGLEAAAAGKSQPAQGFQILGEGHIRQGGALIKGGGADVRYAVRDLNAGELGVPAEGEVGNGGYALCQDHGLDLIFVGDPGHLAAIVCCHSALAADGQGAGAAEGPGEIFTAGAGGGGCGVSGGGQQAQSQDYR